MTIEKLTATTIQVGDYQKYMQFIAYRLNTVTFKAMQLYTQVILLLDVNSQIYVCKSNRSTETIYNCSNLCCMSNTCTRSYWPHRSYVSTDHTGLTQLQYNRTHHTIQCCKEPFTHGREQYRVQIPASAFTTVSSPSQKVKHLNIC